MKDYHNGKKKFFWQNRNTGETLWSAPPGWHDENPASESVDGASYADAEQCVIGFPFVFLVFLFVNLRHNLATEQNSILLGMRNVHEYTRPCLLRHALMRRLVSAEKVERRNQESAHDTEASAGETTTESANEWVKEYHSGKKKFFWKNQRTGETLWKAPPGWHDEDATKINEFESEKSAERDEDGSVSEIAIEGAPAQDSSSPQSPKEDVVEAEGGAPESIETSDGAATEEVEITKTESQTPRTVENVNSGESEVAGAGAETVSQHVDNSDGADNKDDVDVKGKTIKAAEADKHAATGTEEGSGSTQQVNHNDDNASASEASLVAVSTASQNGDAESALGDGHTGEDEDNTITNAHTQEGSGSTQQVDRDDNNASASEASFDDDDDTDEDKPAIEASAKAAPEQPKEDTSPPEADSGEGNVAVSNASQNDDAESALGDGRTGEDEVDTNAEARPVTGSRVSNALETSDEVASVPSSSVSASAEVHSPKRDTDTAVGGKASSVDGQEIKNVPVATNDVDATDTGNNGVSAPLVEGQVDGPNGKDEDSFGEESFDDDGPEPDAPVDAEPEANATGDGNGEKRASPTPSAGAGDAKSDDDTPAGEDRTSDHSASDDENSSEHDFF